MMSNSTLSLMSS